MQKEKWGKLRCTDVATRQGLVQLDGHLLRHESLSGRRRAQHLNDLENNSVSGEPQCLP